MMKILFVFIRTIFKKLNINSEQMDAVKAVKGHYLFNMLQDFRHVLVIDLRPKADWDSNHIRDSFNLPDQTSKEEIQKVVEASLRTAHQKQEKYKQIKKVRRYFFIGGQLPTQKQRMNQVLEVIPKDKDNKLYSLSENYDQFYAQYPVVCLVLADLQKLKEANAPKVELDRWQLYPYCRFPSEIIIDKLYLGGIFSSNSEKILNDMKIKSMVDFIDYEAKEQGGKTEAEGMGNSVPDFKRDESKFSYLHIPINKEIAVQIDFDVICSEIDKKLQNGRVLIYCNDGQTISSAFAIAYLMYKVKLDVTMATLKVCQAISRTDINKWIYAQLLTYKPK